MAGGEMQDLIVCPECGGPLTRPAWLPPQWDQHGVLCYFDDTLFVARRYDCLQCMTRMDRQFEVSRDGELTGRIAAEQRWGITAEQLRVERHLAGLSEGYDAVEATEEEEQYEDVEEPVVYEVGDPDTVPRIERRVSVEGDGDVLAVAGVQVKNSAGEWVDASGASLTKPRKTR